MTTHRSTSIDDHGDQFPGAVPPARATAAPHAAGDALPRMHAAYVHKVNSVVGAGRDGLAVELAETFAAESAGVGQSDRNRRAIGHGAPTRDESGRRPGSAGTRLRRSLDRFDRYTLDVFNAGPGRPQPTRSQG